MEGVELRVPKQTPDLTRTFTINNHAEGVTEDPRVEKRLVDFVEVKRLDTDKLEPWGSPQAEAKARVAIHGYLLQVYTAAMAGFIHNPTWEDVYATLAIGIYFTQLHWVRPPDDVLCTPMKYRDNSSGSLTGEALDRRIAHLNAAIIECKQRPVPEVLCWNEPVVTFTKFRRYRGEPAKGRLNAPVSLVCT